MPARLRPTAPIAPSALLVGDPGRALALAQVLLDAPKMSNHARGLWGYSGESIAGRPLTIQATGMGGPSAALVLDDLHELGVRRAVRVGTCTALRADLAAGALLAVAEAHGWSGPGLGAGEQVAPDPELAARLLAELGASAVPGTVASLDVLHLGGAPAPVGEGDAADMQTAALFGRSQQLGVAAAAVLVVSEGSAGEPLDDEALAEAATLAGRAAAAVL
jgi:uridine phosphorylase